MIAKNNIFNIRKGPKAWKGETGARNGFVEFETREYGITGMDRADAHVSAEAPLCHGARHHHALCTAQREQHAGVYQILSGAGVQVGDDVAQHDSGLRSPGLCYGADGNGYGA